MLYLFLYGLFLIIFYLVKIFPDGYLIGKGLGNLIYWLLKDRREITINNLKLVYGDKLTEREILSLCKEIYQQLGITLVEFTKLDNLKKDDFPSLVDIEGLEYLKEAYALGKGVIVYSAHFGNWEWLASIISLLGYPFNAIARTQDNPYFDRKINEIRSAKGVNIIPRGMAVRKAIKALRRGELLLVLGDQNGRKDGWLMDFFGHPALTYPGAVQLAERTGAVVLPAYLIRKEPGKFLLKIYPYHEIEQDAGEKEQRELLKLLTGTTEDIIDKYPEQWLWLHRRWDLG